MEAPKINKPDINKVLAQLDDEVNKNIDNELQRAIVKLMLAQQIVNTLALQTFEALIKINDYIDAQLRVITRKIGES